MDKKKLASTPACITPRRLKNGTKKILIFYIVPSANKTNVYFCTKSGSESSLGNDKSEYLVFIMDYFFALFLKDKVSWIHLAFKKNIFLKKFRFLTNLDLLTKFRFLTTFRSLDTISIIWPNFRFLTKFPIFDEISIFD